MALMLCVCNCIWCCVAGCEDRADASGPRESARRGSQGEGKGEGEEAGGKERSHPVLSRGAGEKDTVEGTALHVFPDLSPSLPLSLSSPSSPLTSPQQDESSRRHDQQLEQRKKTAISSRHTSSEDAPRVEAYLRSKWCSVCNVKVWECEGVYGDTNLIGFVPAYSHSQGILPPSLSPSPPPLLPPPPPSFPSLLPSFCSLPPPFFPSSLLPSLLPSLLFPQIISEVYLLSHLRGLRHQETLAALPSAPDPVIVEAPEEQLSSQQAEVEERMRAGRKRAKKLRHRMASRYVWGEGGRGRGSGCVTTVFLLCQSS